MKFGVASQSALEALLSNPLRSLLTMLGIIIGVASVMIMMSIGEGARAQIEAQISSVGTNMLTLQPGIHTAVLSGVNGATGEALVEVYEVQ